MKGGSSDKVEPPPDLGNVDSDELASNERTRILPWHCGETLNGAVWICDPFAQYTKDATDTDNKKTGTGIA